MNKFKSLQSAKEIALDIETYDPSLKELGPGVRREGYIIGISLATSDGFNEYFPIEHSQGKNLNKEKVIKYLQVQLGRSNQPKLGANILYDLDYLFQYKINVTGPWYDVQVAEPLLNENRKVYNLDSLAEEYLKVHKEVSEIDKYCDEKGWKGKPQAHLWKMPPEIVSKYAKADTLLPIKIFKKQKKKLIEQGLWDLFILETENLPLLLKMRREGIPVNIRKVNQLIIKYGKELKTITNKIKIEDLWEARAIAKIFDKKKIKYNRTRTGEPSFTMFWLENHKNKFCNLLAEARKLNKFISTFLGGLQTLTINHRIHPLFYPLKGDDYGTVSGRFSASHINPQFMPNKKADPIKGPEIRSCFKADKDHYWYRADYSQVELRILAHYAIGPGSKEIREEYQKDPNTDYHDLSMKITGLERKPSKKITFGVVYGMGKKGLADKLNVPFKKAEEILNQYFNNLPFVRKTLYYVSNVAQRRGYIFTILGRQRRFNSWEPADWELSRMTKAITNKKEMIDYVNDCIKNHPKGFEEKTIRPGVKRAWTYKALNSLIQGSAADLMKKAMNKIYKSGLTDELKIYLTVHDELDVGAEKTKIAKEAVQEMVYIMENAIKFKVPIITELEKGTNWGNLKKVKI